MRRLCALGFLALLGLPRATEAQTTAPCAIASDPEFGYTREKAIPVGGGVFTGSARERRYLGVLRGPAGQPVTVLPGVGSAMDPATKQIIDSIRVTYEGPEKPIALYLNMYAFATPQVPQGFSCSESPSAAIGPPPPEQAATLAAIGAHALAEGVSRPLSPYALRDAAGAVRAQVFDFFNLAAARARRDAGRGQNPNPQMPPATLILALSLQCAGSVVSATAVDVVGGQGQLAPRAPQLGTGPMLANVVPDAAIPDGAVGALIPAPFLPTPGNVRITYPKSDMCPDLPQEVTIPLRAEASRLLVNDPPPLPAGIVEPDPSVFVHAVLDVDGTLKQPSYIAGPRSLMSAASEALKSWKGEPARMNGTPVVSVVSLRVGFKR